MTTDPIERVAQQWHNYHFWDCVWENAPTARRQDCRAEVEAVIAAIDRCGIPVDKLLSGEMELVLKPSTKCQFVMLRQYRQAVEAPSEPTGATHSEKPVWPWCSGGFNP